MEKYTLPHISIVVNDLLKTKEFYLRLGFKGIYKESSNKEEQYDYLLFEGFNMQIEAWYFRSKNHDKKADQDKYKIGITHFAVVCNDIKKLKDKFLKKGIRMFKDIKTIDIGDSFLSFFYIEDPSGILIEFVEKPKYK